jgi:hypothetical protein
MINENQTRLLLEKEDFTENQINRLLGTKNIPSTIVSEI